MMLLRIEWDDTYSFVYDVSQLVLYRVITREEWIQKVGESDGEDEFQYAKELTKGMNEISQETRFFL